jgi:Holliday junction resolvase RusA-like endonuclease
VTTTIVLEPPCAFINANQRLHFHQRNELTQSWRKAAAKAIESQFEPYHYTRAHIVCEIRFPDNRRRDVGNYYPTAKAIVDGLVDSLLLPDDNDRHLIGPDMRREYPNGPARVTVTIEEIPA